jgi:hypothetical protein
MTDRIVPAAATSKPFYDDFDEDKLFLRMLFRPGYAVQGRELTQLQTILQKQIDRFGSSIFKNNSLVTGGETSVDKKVLYLQVEDTFSGVTVDPTIFLNQRVQDTLATSISGTVVAVQTKSTNGSEPAALIVQLNGSTQFGPGRALQIPNSSNFIQIKSVATGSASSVIGGSSIARVNSGIFFVNGIFVKNLAQTIILDPYSTVPTYRVGFEISQNIVTETSDTSLLDPALESSNNQAPGAARYQIVLTLSKRDIDSTDSSTFIELLRVVGGQVQSKIKYPDLSGLGDTLARRTYDTNGDYTVKAFRLVLREDTGVGLVGRATATLNSTVVSGTNSIFTLQVQSGDTLAIDGKKYTVANVSSNTVLNLTTPAVQNSNNYIASIIRDSRYTAQLDRGKAYVKGYEFSTMSPTRIITDKARDTANVNNYEIALNYGNYFIANSPNGFIDTTTTPIVDLHNVYSSGINTGSYTSTKVGTARVLSIDSTGTSGFYRTHLYDIRFSSNASFSNVKSISLDSSKSATANVSGFSQDSANLSFLTDTSFRTFIFRFPQLAIAPDSITSPAYPTKYSFTSQNFNNSGGTSTSGTLTLPSGKNYIGTGTLDSFTTGVDFIVEVKDRQSSNLTTGQILTYADNGLRVTIASPTTATISAAANSAFVGNIIAVVNQETSTAKTKVLVSANSSVLSNTGGFTVGTTRVFPNTGQISLGSSTITNSNVWFPLYLADVDEDTVKIVQNVTSAADLTDTSKDITSHFQIDNGQRDYIYDYAQIKLKTGQSAPSGNVVVLTNYYTHSGTGYFTVDSYPNANTSNGYSAISDYTSATDGSTYNLRNCIDFRPRRIDANTASAAGDLTTTPGYTIQNAGLFSSESTFLVDSYQYYLSRIDKIILTRDLVFKIVKGIPAIKPLPPPDDPDGMTLYSLVLPAYTFKATDIVVNYVENKRYTMRDIGNLEKRIQNLEYYNALNLLEQNANALTITDDQGNNRSKYGVLVDSFQGWQIADAGSADIAVSMDTQNGYMYPAINQNNIKLLSVDASSSTANANGIIMLPYTEEIMISQDKATDFEPVAAYAFSDWLGTVSLYPASDYWYDTQQAPDVVVNLNGQNDNWEQFGQLLEKIGSALPTAQNPFNTVYGSWETVWTGSTQLSQSTFDQTTTGANGTTVDTIQRTVTDNQTGQTQIGVTTSIAPQTITSSLGNKVVDTSIIPYIRPQNLYFTAINLRPGRPMTMTFDGVDVTNYCQRLNVIFLANNTPSFISGMPNGETITGPGGYSAKVVMSTTDALYVTNETGTPPSNTSIVVGSTSAASATVDHYSHRTGNAVSATANTITLQSVASANANGYISNPFIYITSGTGNGQRRIIASYNATSQIVTVDHNWDTTPDTTSIYSLGSHITTPTGQLAGIFSLPSSPISFHTGERVFRMSDSIGSAADIATCTTSADAQFEAQGLLNTVQNDLVSIQVPEVVRTSSTETRVIDDVTTTDSTISSVTYPPDPPATPVAPPPSGIDNDNYHPQWTTSLQFESNAGWSTIPSIDITGNGNYIYYYGGQYLQDLPGSGLVPITDPALLAFVTSLGLPNSVPQSWQISGG